MQKARNAQYAGAGVQAMPGIRMNVRSYVRLPDSEAGSGFVMAQEPYSAVPAAPRRARRHIMVSARFGALFLCAVFLLFGIRIVSKASQRAQIVKQISEIEENIAAANKKNADLAVQVAAAKDSVNICYEAVQRLGMIASVGVQYIPVDAPLTRPAQPLVTVTAAQETSPFSALDGIMSGSR